jgi:hypothetical protein
MEPDPTIGFSSSLAFFNFREFFLDVTGVSICIIEGIDMFENPIWDSWDPVFICFH